MTPFQPVVPNPDLWVNPSPEGPWARVAVCSRWVDSETIAARWKYKPAVVGPLRTDAGLDLLVRSLLANPQIRVVFVDGHDLRPTNGAERVVRAFFEEKDLSVLPEELRELARALLDEEEVQVQGQAPGVVGRGPPGVQWTGAEKGETFQLVEDLHQEWLRAEGGPRRGGLLVHFVDFSADRRGGRHILPPPRPVVTDAAPHGDPGDRVAGNLLSEVYVRALHQVLVAGRIVPTQYGLTRELLDLVTVIRDPEGSVREFSEVEEVPPVPVGTWIVGYSRVCSTCRDVEAIKAGCSSCFGLGRVPSEQTYVSGDKIGHFSKMFHEFHPDEVAATASYRRHEAAGTAIVLRPFDGVSKVSPDPAAWRALHEASSGKHPVLGMSAEDLFAYTYGEDGFLGTKRPSEAPYAYGERMRGSDDGSALKKAQARLDESVPAPHPDQVSRVGKLLLEAPGTRAAYLSPWWPDEDAGKESGRPCLVGAWFRSIPGAVVRASAEPYGEDPESAMLAAVVESVEIEAPPTLHLTVVFRSHDLLEAYPQNLGACCRWLVDEAVRLGQSTGTVTCISMSAHLYERGWEKAEKLWKKYRRKQIRWDGRAGFRVEKVPDPSKPPPEVKVGARVQRPLDLGCAVVLEVVEVRPPERTFFSPTVEARAVCWLDKDGIEHHRDTERWSEVPESVRLSYRDPLTYSVVQWREMTGWRQSMLLRAVATVPGESRVVGVFEASTGAALRFKLEDSGLVQELGAAMWLGSEIERVENGGL